MGLFLSTAVNKVDKKGRVSVPASFRDAVSDTAFKGVILFPSHNHACLEGVSMSFMSEINERLNMMDFFSDAQDDLATAIFGQSVQLSFDGDGRIILPEALREYAHLSDAATFVGLGNKFQIWSPEAYEQRKAQSLSRVKEQGLTLSSNGRSAEGA